MSKHTPGPWRMRAAIKPDEFEIKDEQSSGGYAPIARVKGDKRWTMEHTAANARLIAAAPELLDALKVMLEQFTKTPSTLKDSECRVKAHAAIAKATGEEA